MNMRTLGLIGGTSYHSTVDYYMGINKAVADELGGHSSASLILRSLNFQQVRDFQVSENWDGAAQLYIKEARLLQQAGAEAIMICANLMHKVAPMVEQAVDIPVIHIADAVASVAAQHGFTSLGIMGAKWTMEDGFYADRLRRHGIHPVIASQDDIDFTDACVFDELTQGIFLDESRSQLFDVAQRLSHEGADAVIEGCTELPLIMSQKDTHIPLIDSTKAHVDAAVSFVLGTRDTPKR
ncbi:MAG: amino acid racemase [Propionibacteriaceae bacterium]|nr:amino acid racemase [Propionibacteriaceae bacterium]